MSKKLPEKADVEALADMVEALSELINAFPEATDKGLLRDGLQCLLDVALEADIACGYGLFNDEARNERSKPTAAPEAGPETPTLRDFFAAHIAGGVEWPSPSLYERGEEAARVYAARGVFLLADAMLVARGKK